MQCNDGRVLANAVNPGDVLMIEPGGRSSLLVEPLDDLGIGRLIGRQQLERDMTIKLHVEGSERRAHAAHADRVFEHERSHNLAGPGQRGRRALLRRLEPANRTAGRAHHRRRISGCNWFCTALYGIVPQPAVRGTLEVLIASGICIDSSSSERGPSPGSTSMRRQMITRAMHEDVSGDKHAQTPAPSRVI